jgi:hypothetical protein
LGRKYGISNILAIGFVNPKETIDNPDFKIISIEKTGRRKQLLQDIKEVINKSKIDLKIADLEIEKERNEKKETRNNNEEVKKDIARKKYLLLKSLEDSYNIQKKENKEKSNTNLDMIKKNMNKRDKRKKKGANFPCCFEVLVRINNKKFISIYTDFASSNFNSKSYSLDKKDEFEQRWDDSYYYSEKGLIVLCDESCTTDEMKKSSKPKSK